MNPTKIGGCQLRWESKQLAQTPKHGYALYMIHRGRPALTKPWLHAQKPKKNNINPKPWFLKAMILAKIPVPPFHLDPPGLHNTLVPSSCWYTSSYLQVAVWPSFGANQKDWYQHPMNFWLVVDLPLCKIWLRQLGWWNSQLNGKIKFMFQTTNQILMGSGNDVPGGDDRKIWVSAASRCVPPWHNISENTYQGVTKNRNKNRHQSDEFMWDSPAINLPWPPQRGCLTNHPWPSWG